MNVDDITCLAYFEFNIDGGTWDKYFQEAGGDKDMADHLWEKFHGYGHNFLRTFGNSDLSNRKLLFEVATRWCKEKEYPTSFGAPFVSSEKCDKNPCDLTIKGKRDELKEPTLKELKAKIREDELKIKKRFEGIGKGI